MSQAQNITASVVEAFWRLMATNDFASVGAVLADEFVLDWPQTNERIRGRERFAAMNAEYPANGPWQFEVHRIVATEGEAVSDVGVTDGVQRPGHFLLHGRGRQDHEARGVLAGAEPGTRQPPAPRRADVVMRSAPPARRAGHLFAIKAAVGDTNAAAFAFGAHKTMYGGKHVAVGDTVFVFASENEGGPGLVARGVVTSAEAVAKKAGVERQTPRVDISVRRTATAKRRLGRNELKPFCDWGDGRPQTELNFKFYRQATNKIVGLSDEAAAFLDACF